MTKRFVVGEDIRFGETAYVSEEDGFLYSVGPYSKDLLRENLQLKVDIENLKKEKGFSEDQEKLLHDVLRENTELKVELEKSKFFDICRLQRKFKDLKESDEYKRTRIIELLRESIEQSKEIEELKTKLQAEKNQHYTDTIKQSQSIRKLKNRIEHGVRWSKIEQEKWHEENIRRFGKDYVNCEEVDEDSRSLKARIEFNRHTHEVYEKILTETK